MTKPVLHDLSQEEPATASDPRQAIPPAADRRLADAEMARVLGTEPVRMALDASGGSSPPSGTTSVTTSTRTSVKTSIGTL